MTLSKAQKIRQRTLVGGGLVVALVALFWMASGEQGGRVVAVVGTILACVGAFEAKRMGLPFVRTSLLGLWSAVILAQAPWLIFWDPDLSHLTEGLDLPDRYWIAMGLSLAMGVVVYGILHFLAPGTDRDSSSTVASQRVASPGASFNARQLALVWLVTPLAFLYPVRIFGGLDGLIALLVLSKLGDIAGYYVGNLMGKTHPFPKLSPGKTTAGCVGSFVAGVLAGVACQAGGLLPAAPLALFPGLWAGAAAGATINLAAQAGDLYESFWKRKTGVKDSGTWFGPSGGMLDLVDSLLITAPLAALTWPFLFQWFVG